MTTAYTSLLGLALPVTGELSGTWGDTVNTAITSLLDTAVAGTTSITTDADITLTTTTGASNQARQAIILWNPASGTTTRYITAPAQSKLYTVINASGGTQSIVIRGAGPTTGVTIAKGESAMVAWNGSDFVKVSSSGGALTLTDLTVTGNTILGDAAADTLTVNATSTFASPVNFQGQVKLPSTGRSAAAALSPTNPAFMYGVASTYTDTTSSGTLSPVGAFYALSQPTLSTSNVTTYTTAATLYIANAPAAGGSATITNPYALYVASGNSIFSTSVTIGFGANSATLNLNANTASAGVSNQVLFQAAGTSKWALGGGNIGSGGTNDFGIYNYVTSTNALIITSAANNATFSGKAAFNGASILSGVTVKDSLAITAASGAQYLLMGNQDVAGANKPLVLSAGNANLFIGYGDSWSSATGGTVTNLFAFTPTGRLGVNNSSPSYTLDVTGDARISTKGYIGTAPISNAILSVGGTGTEATDLATARTTAAFMMTPYSGSAWALAIGSASGQIPYFQGIDSGSATARNISLQPYGENVGVGTTSPAASSGLHIYGTRTLVRPVIQSYNATTSAEPSLQLSSGTATSYNTYWGIMGGTAASYEYYDNRTGTGDTYWQKSGSNKMALYSNSGNSYLDIGVTGLLSSGGASGLRLAVYTGMWFGGSNGAYTFGSIRQNTSSPFETIITANAYPANTGVNSAVWIRSGTSGGGGPVELAYFRSDGVNFINTTSGGASELNIRHPNGSSSGSLSITASSAGGGGASYFLLGNSDSGGTTGPVVIASANRALQFGVGDSFASRSGGTFTEYWRINSSGQLQKTLTGDGTAIQILGSYSGNPSMITMGQSASDGYINIYSAGGDATHLAGYSSDTSYFTSRLVVGYNGASLSNTKFMVNGNASFGDYSTSSGFTFVKAIKVDYSSNNGPTSFNIRLNGTSVGEYYAKIFLVGLDPYSDTGYTTYTAEVTGYLSTGIGTVISSAENPNNSFTFGTPSFAANYVNIAVTTNSNTNYRFTLCAMVVSNGGMDKALSMSVA